MSTNLENGPSFGQRLQQLRKACGLTKRELGVRVGRDLSYLSNIEEGIKKSPSVHLAAQIAAALGVTVEELISGQRLPSAGGSPADAAFYQHYLTCDDEVRARVRAVANVLIAEGS